MEHGSEEVSSHPLPPPPNQNASYLTYSRKPQDSAVFRAAGLQSDRFWKFIKSVRLQQLDLLRNLEILGHFETREKFQKKRT
jgi:hypothetical protein